MDTITPAHTDPRLLEPSDSVNADPRLADRRDVDSPDEASVGDDVAGRAKQYWGEMNNDDRMVVDGINQEAGVEPAAEPDPDRL